MQGGLFAATTAGTELATDIETGFLNRLQLTPLRAPAILIGQLAGAMVVAFLVVAGLPARRPGRRARRSKAGVGGAVVLIALAMLVALAFGALGAIIGARTGSAEAVQGMFPLLFVFFFLSSMNLPRNLIQADWFRTIATWNPISYLVEGLRSLVITGWDGTALWRCLVTVVAISVARVPRGQLVAAHEDGADMSGHTLSVARAVARRSLLHAFTNPALLIPSIVFPLIFLVELRGRAVGGARRAGLRLPRQLHGVPVRVRVPAVGCVRRRVHGLRHRGGLRVGLRAADAAGVAAPVGHAARLRGGRASCAGCVTAVLVTIASLLAGMTVYGNGVRARRAWWAWRCS